jgi:hypothetical protein
MNRLTILGFMVSLLLTPIAFQAANADTTVTSTANISGTCGLVTAPTALNYGTVAPNAQSVEQLLVLNNTGTVTTQIQVNGTNWTSSAITHLVVGKTKYAFGTTATPDPVGVAYASKTALTSTLTGTAVVSPANTNSTYWQLEASNLTNLPFSGALSQTITFTFSC